MKNKNIENYFEKFLPQSYIETLEKSKLNNIGFNSLISKRNKLINALKLINVELDKLAHERQLLISQSTFIKKKYIPKVYYKQYYKKNQSILFSHIIIKYHLISKTIYFGKVDSLIILFSNLNLQLDVNNFKEKIFPLLLPKVLDFLSNIKNEAEFKNLKIKSTQLISFIIEMENNVADFENNGSLLDYIKSLS